MDDAMAYDTMRRQLEAFVGDLERARQALADCSAGAEVNQRALELCQARVQALENENRALQGQYQRAAECDARMAVYTATMDDLRKRYNDLKDSVGPLLAKHGQPRPAARAPSDAFDAARFRNGTGPGPRVGATGRAPAARTDRRARTVRQPALFPAGFRFPPRGRRTGAAPGCEEGAGPIAASAGEKGKSKPEAWQQTVQWRRPPACSSSRRLRRRSGPSWRPSRRWSRERGAPSFFVPRPQVTDCDTQQTTALRECEVGRRKAASVVHRMPEGRLEYHNCYRERPDDRVLTDALGSVSVPEGGVLECARLAAERSATPNADVHFALFKGSECYLVTDPTAVARHGTTSGCNANFDQRGANMGGRTEFSLFTLHPRGLQARYVQTGAPPCGGLPAGLQRTAAGGDLHIGAIVALGAKWTPLPVVGVRITHPSGATPGLLTTLPVQTLPRGWRRLCTRGRGHGGRLAGGPAGGGRGVGTRGYVPASRAGRGQHGDTRTGHRPGCRTEGKGGHPRGEATRAEALVLRNRAEPGRPEVEGALRGCVVRLLDHRQQSVFERRIGHGAAEYQWEVR